MQGVGPDTNFKCSGFPKAKHPNLGVRKTVWQAAPYESYDLYIRLYLDRKIARSVVS